jgi:hypothetical protein
MDGAIGAGGERGAQRRLHAGAAERDRDHLAATELFLHAQRLLDRELVVRVQDQRHARGSSDLPSAATFTRVSVSGTCLMHTTWSTADLAS